MEGFNVNISHAMSVLSNYLLLETLKKVNYFHGSKYGGPFYDLVDGRGVLTFTS